MKSFSKWRLPQLLVLVLLALTVISPVPAAAAPDISAESTQHAELTAENAETFLDEFFSDPDVKQYYTGAAIVVVKDGKTILQKGYGYADAAKKETVDPSKSVFRLASVSKVFTATAVMQLVERGKIDLQEDIATYLGNITYDNPFKKPVTVEHLLTHTTGFQIRDPKPTDIHHDFDQFVEIEDYVRENMPPVVREPGTSYMYDNFASMLQGLIVEKVSGIPFQTYMEQHVFNPLNMKNSSFLLDDRLKENLVVGYEGNGEPLEMYTVTPTVMPQGGMLSTAEDIAKFMIAFLNGGSIESTQILSQDSTKAMTVYRSKMHSLLPDTTYGFEAPLQIPGAGSSSNVITKGGDMPGNSSYLWLIPEENTGIFITYNNMGALRNLLYPAFMTYFFPEYMEPVEFEAFEPDTAEELSKYNGLYVDLRAKSMVTTVEQEEGNLTVSDSLLGKRSLVQVGPDLFMDENKQLTAFKRGEDGSIMYLKEPYLNPLGYEQKGQLPVGFKDIDLKHPYAEYILGLQSIGILENDHTIAFEPDRPITRAEYVEDLLHTFGWPKSEQPVQFQDVKGHPAASVIQGALEIGLIENKDGFFYPDRAISRQEAAAMIWRLVSTMIPSEVYSDVKLAGETDDWAIPAVQMMVAFGYYGPEVQPPAQDGSIDFLSKRPLTHQEEAALLYKLLTKAQPKLQ